MSLPESILAYLSAMPDGATDAELFQALDAKYYQQINDRCRSLARRGLIRRELDGKVIRNYHRDAVPRATAPTVPTVPAPLAIPARSWYWEGNVQARVVKYLVDTGYHILRVADTVSREGGRDVAASRDGRDAWVSVKGRPEGTLKTNAATQARVWFHGALFDAICWRNESQDAEIFLAMPDYPTYRNLSPRVEWLLKSANFRVAWIHQDGSIEVT